MRSYSPAMVPAKAPRGSGGGSGSVTMAPPWPSRTRLSATSRPVLSNSLAWVLALVPSVWLILSGTNNLTGGGFEVAGSQSLRVQHAIEEHFPTEGASPLILHSADEVALLADGRIVARGSHVELLSRPDYRQVVARGMDGE